MINYDEWYKKLLELKERAYVPYSNFHVACICLLKNNKEIVGVNVENASYSVGICAERVCLSQVYSQGYGKFDIEGIYLYIESENNPFPCGMCCQFIFELICCDTEIRIYNKIGKVFVFKISELLPYSFSKINLLNKDIK